MKSTKQVRAWLRAYIGQVPYVTVYTNKVKNPAIRHVKIYRDEITAAEFHDLSMFAGSVNVRVTTPGRAYPDRWGSRAGVIIRCMYDPYFE